jgi:hypothetical protein
MKLKFNIHKNLIFNFLIIAVLLPSISFSQLGNNMYGLYRQLNPSSVTFVEMNPVNGIITPIGNPALSSTINTTGVSLNPYNLSYSNKDEYYWL